MSRHKRDQHVRIVIGAIDLRGMKRDEHLKFLLNAMLSSMSANLRNYYVAIHCAQQQICPHRHFSNGLELWQCHHQGIIAVAVVMELLSLFCRFRFVTKIYRLLIGLPFFH